jgi:chloramphenicol 3-O phosphotransferase
MIKEGEVILINGTSCAGKTSLAREIQAAARKPYISTGHDDFLPMFPGRYVGIDKVVQPEIANWAEPGNALSSMGFEVILTRPGDPPEFNFFCGPVGWNMLAGMHRAFAAMARAGNNLVIADVISEVPMYDYCAALKELKTVYLIGIQCPLPELERREATHANRTVGGARMQLKKINHPGEYDCTVDTGRHSPAECARQVLDYIDNNPPRVFAKLVERYGDFEVKQFPVTLW